MLAAVARLLSDASAVHACFVYLLEDGGERLVLRGASDPYGHLAGTVALERGEGLAWSAVERREPAFIREGARRDPRFKYVREIDEERFQSLVSVPMLGRDGAPIGTITLHTEAPREFSESEVEFLASSGALVAGVVENARLYAEARRRVAELEHLAELGEAAASAPTLDELLPVGRGAHARAARRERVPGLPGATGRRRAASCACAAPAEARDGARASDRPVGARARARPQRPPRDRRGAADRRRRPARAADRRRTATPSTWRARPPTRSASRSARSR